MKIFLDSADLDEIIQARNYGILDGVTTNPSLLKKAVLKRQKQGQQVDMQDYIRQILLEAWQVPVSLEVIGLDQESMLRQGRFLYYNFNKLAGNVYIKVPVNPALELDDSNHFHGLSVIKALADEGIPVNCTLVFTPEQALLAAKAGAAIVSPFAGRVDDFLRQENKLPFVKTDYFPAQGLESVQIPSDAGIVSGIDLVDKCVELLELHGFSTEVLAASLRNPRQTREAALTGAHIATLPLEVISDLLIHDKTLEGMRLFTEDVVPEYAQFLEQGSKDGQDRL